MMTNGAVENDLKISMAQLVSSRTKNFSPKSLSSSVEADKPRKFRQHAEPRGLCFGRVRVERVDANDWRKVQYDHANLMSF
jgi:hypothetical protein